MAPRIMATITGPPARPRRSVSPPGSGTGTSPSDAEHDAEAEGEHVDSRHRLVGIAEEHAHQLQLLAAREHAHRGRRAASTVSPSGTQSVSPRRMP
jgi:hypothetical protein